MKFTILGKPVPLGRPRVRVVAIKGRKPFATVYPAPASKAWEGTIRNTAAMEMRSNGWQSFDGPLRVCVYLTPKGIKSGKAPKVVGDLDNHVKAALDALNGLAFLDDAQVKELHAYQMPASATGGLTIEIEPIK